MFCWLPLQGDCYRRKTRDQNLAKTVRCDLNATNMVVFDQEVQCDSDSEDTVVVPNEQGKFLSYFFFRLNGRLSKCLQLSCRSMNVSKLFVHTINCVVVRVSLLMNVISDKCLANVLSPMKYFNHKKSYEFGFKATFTFTD